MKRKTKKKTLKIIIGIMLITITLPLFSGFVPQKNSQQITVDPQTLQTILETQQENIPVLPDIEGDYPIVDVLDGESISIMYGQEEKTAKLIGINVPDNMKQAAEKFLKKELTKTDMVSLEFDVKDKDEEENLLVYAYLPEDQYTTINSKLLMQGYAKLEEKSENQRYIEDLRGAEKQAQEQRRGLWNKPNNDEEMKHRDR